MKTLLDVCKRLFRRRRHERFSVRNGTYVGVSFVDDDYRERTLQLVDISTSGASFIYRGYAVDLEESGFLRLFSHTPDSERLRFKTLSDTLPPGYHSLSQPYRLRTLRFEAVRASQRKDLEIFIKQVALCRK